MRTSRTLWLHARRPTPNLSAATLILQVGVIRAIGRQIKGLLACTSDSKKFKMISNQSCMKVIYNSQRILIWWRVWWRQKARITSKTSHMCSLLRSDLLMLTLNCSTRRHWRHLLLRHRRARGNEVRYRFRTRCEGMAPPLTQKEAETHFTNQFIWLRVRGLLQLGMTQHRSTLTLWGTTQMKKNSRAFSTTGMSMAQAR